MTQETILIDDIDDTDRLRPVDPSHAALIAESIKEKGLIQPIVVRTNESGDGKEPYILIAGGHRLAAMKLLGWDKLIVGETVIVRDTDAISAKIDEIDENLARYDLNALDRALFFAERKRLYDQQRAETRGGDRKTDKFKEKIKMANFAILKSDRFDEDAAARTGWSERTIRFACQIAEKLDKEAIAAIRGTMVENNQVELRALAMIEPAQQRQVAGYIKSGEARTVLQGKYLARIEKEPINDPQARIFTALMENFEKASKQTRKRFMEAYRLAYAPKIAASEQDEA